MNYSKKGATLIIKLCTIQCLAIMCVSQDFDFFYFVQQWPGSYCELKRSCCYPKTGKPASNFGIHGLWPSYKDGSYPSNCDPDSPFDASQIWDLRSSMQIEWPSLACPSSDNTKFWGHEWNKHGTCSESVLNQHDYFASALNLKNKTDILESLRSAGIKPNGESYGLMDIKKAIEDGVGYSPYIECNVDDDDASQLYQVYLCVDTSGSNLIHCPLLPRGNCDSQIQFPTF